MEECRYTYDDVLFLFSHHDLYSSQILNVINDDVFSCIFETVPSPPDGHCFLHSIVASLNSQGKLITLDEVIQAIEFECFDNFSRYLPFMGDTSCLLFYTAMHNYTVLRQYNSDFVDLIPQICSNALNCDINILVKHSDSFIFCRSIPIDGSIAMKAFVRKNGDHYDSLIRLIPSTSADTSANVCNSSVSEQTNACLDGEIRNQSSVSGLSTQSTRSESRDGSDDFCMHSKIDIESLESFGICFHNIHGLSLDKISDDSLGSFFKKFLLILIAETWLCKEDDLDKLDGYTFHNLCRTYRHPNAIRNSGGLGIYVHKSVEHGVKFISQVDDIIATMVIKKEVFGLPFDIYVSNCYIVPENSTHLTDDVFAILHREIAKMPSEDGSLMFLDANAHTNIALDFNVDVSGSDSGLDHYLADDKHMNNERQLITDLFNQGKLERHSSDLRPLNPHAHDLLDLCKACNMLLLNSRVPGNDFKLGLSTHYNPDGSSGVLDYVICSPNMFDRIDNLTIHGKFPESDHCPVSITFPVNIQPGENTHSDSNLVWQPTEQFVWNKDDLPKIDEALENFTSSKEYRDYIDAITLNDCTDRVAKSFNSYVTSSCKSVCDMKKTSKKKRRFRRVKWYDQELRNRRRDAIKAGERVLSARDRANLVHKTRLFRSCLQRKKRTAKNKRRADLIKTFKNDASKIWAELNRDDCVNEGDVKLRNDLLNHFVEIGKPTNEEYFNEKHLKEIQSFLKEYESSTNINESTNHEINEILNKNFTLEEIEFAIDGLKSGKSPGVDSIPAEFVKHCKNRLSVELHIMFNYILEKREFPESWAEGLKSAIFKSGLRNKPSNYRGITILGIFAKIFEKLVSNRFEFVNEAFNKLDPKNGGFLKGKRTTDNLFFLNGLVKRQLNLNKALYVCFIDFSKAFDMVNRDILFFKLLNSGWSGRLLDTVRDLYKKTSFRFKFEGFASPNFSSSLGVNQGGNASGFLFRKYLSDLSDYLHDKYGVCIGDSVLAHILWADDLVLFSDSISGIQKQLNGLFSFCSDNMMIVNELKTKMMVFGNAPRADVFFNGNLLKWVDKYKYLGNIISSIKTANGDIFKDTYSYLSDKARKAIFLFFRKSKSYGSLPPDIMLKAYSTLVQPILLYGSDVWGHSKCGGEVIDKTCLFFLRCILKVKRSTSNLMTFGELGVIPPSVLANINSIIFHLRLTKLSENDIVKTLFNDLCEMNDNGFDVLKAHVVARNYELDISSCLFDDTNVKIVKNFVKSFYCHKWQDIVYNSNSTRNSSLRLYKNFKNSFTLEPYLLCVDNDKHRNALSRFRCSSHLLEIEKARHQIKIPPIWDRVCPHCKYAVDDELHLLLFCKVNDKLRKDFMSSVIHYIPNITTMHHSDKFDSIMSSSDKNVLRNLAKFIHESFEIRKQIIK